MEAEAKTKASSGVLTGAEIEKYNIIPEGQLKRGNLKSASYDMTVGDRHFIYAGSGNWTAVYIGDIEELDRLNNSTTDERLKLRLPARGGKNLIIPPFGSAIIQLAEDIDLYSVAEKEHLLITGRFDLKLKAIYKGLISQQATQVEPYYKGKLYCFLHNLGSQEVVLEAGSTIATIEFSVAGENIAEEEWEKIKADAEKENKKYKESKFANPTGIADVRWLFEQQMLPEECGIAPIYNLANGNVENAVRTYMEKSETVERLSERVGNRLNERQNGIKVLLTLITAVIAYFAINFVVEIQTELKYFAEELAFLAETAEKSPEALQAFQNHAGALAQTRQCMLILTGLFILAVLILMFAFFFGFMRPMYDRKWRIKKRTLFSKLDFDGSSKETKSIKRLYKNLDKLETLLNGAGDGMEDEREHLKNAKLYCQKAAEDLEHNIWRARDQLREGNLEYAKANKGWKEKKKKRSGRKFPCPFRRTAPNPAAPNQDPPWESPEERTK